MQSLSNPVFFEQVFTEHWELMYQSAYRKIGDQAIVEDLIQEIFVDIWKRRESLEIKSGIKAYLLTAVKYQVMRYLDEQAKNRVQNKEEWVGYYEEDIFAFEELYHEIEVAVTSLPPRAAVIFRMSRLEGYSVEEIAEKLQVSPQTIHNQLSKSLKVMRRELKHLAPMLALVMAS
ncbi:sigma-70 family RNA polymerase sigma factor [Algoriphagus aestuariicola]|jgi:RNA polymerase sigma-70 factor (ECF subfamily)|uniref:Sigma-70 family RNA polymerase sigma factor n=1 Tax=Algoriphagus aestuariicola TaxID=1852016 RepID=A0ABS3BPC0_9BACT|nr:sigma-70 family RNA polymerase sigma factor [Algoriphagus aestuariicola]MBN7800900.1 sigma-70 family RNA polymerase sigma factor [Algoriphagus aestuariicola]